MASDSPESRGTEHHGFEAARPDVDSATFVGEVHRQMDAHDPVPVMYVARMDAILNRWFTTYGEARASLLADGGYLFPYRGQFFVTLREGVRELGLDPDDPDWGRIGWDWVHPGDREAWERLRSQRELST